MNIYTNIFMELVSNWWQVRVGILFTWASWLFGDGILLLIDPDFAKAWIPLLITLLIGVTTVIVTILKGRKALLALDRESDQDKITHYWENVKKLKEMGFIKDDTPLEEINKMLTRLNISIPDNQKIKK